MNLVPGTPIGKYVVRRKLAEGGMAEIYLASLSGPEGFEKDVVIKRIRSFLASDPAFVEMFKAEARVASRLNHANIVQIFDFGNHQDSWYIAMEYVRGRSLWDLRKRSREQMAALPPTLVAHIGSEVARGLHYAHKLRLSGRPPGLVHRDVTPHNILLSYDGAVKLTDFGIAKDGSRLTSPGMLKGKFAYMSPEQARGDEVDSRTDIFALGIVLWEMLTGARLFVSDSDVATLRAVQHAVIVPPARLNPAVGPELDTAVMRALEREPSRRFQTAQELERALRDFVLRYAKSVDETDAGVFLRRLFAPELAADGVDRTHVAMAAIESSRSDSGSSDDDTALLTSERSGEQERAARTNDDHPSAPGGEKKITVAMRVRGRSPRPVDATVGPTPTIDASLAPPGPSRITQPMANASPSGRRSRLFVAVSGAVVTAGALAFAVYAAAGIRARPDPDRDRSTAAAPSGGATAEARRSPGPPRASSSAEGPRLTSSAPAASEPAPSPPAPEPRPAQAETDAPDLGTLVVNVTPWANVVIAGEDKGEVVGKRQWDLPSGRYLVRFIHPKKTIDKVVLLTRARRTTVRFDALAK